MVVRHAHFKKQQYKSHEIIAHRSLRLCDLSSMSQEMAPTSHAYLGNSYMLQLLPHS